MTLTEARAVLLAAYPGKSLAITAESSYSPALDRWTDEIWVNVGTEAFEGSNLELCVRMALDSAVAPDAAEIIESIRLKPKYAEADAFISAMKKAEIRADQLLSALEEARRGL
jgi:hypothetical protein